MRHGNLPHPQSRRPRPEAGRSSPPPTRPLHSAGASGLYVYSRRKAVPTRCGTTEARAKRTRETLAAHPARHQASQPALAPHDEFSAQTHPPGVRRQTPARATPVKSPISRNGSEQACAPPGKPATAVLISSPNIPFTVIQPNFGDRAAHDRVNIPSFILTCSAPLAGRRPHRFGRIVSRGGISRNDHDRPDAAVQRLWLRAVDAALGPCAECRRQPEV
jgi:hypothetical protein